MLGSLRRLVAAWRRWCSATLPNELRIARLRRRGVRIGKNCLILTDKFSTEPYLVELGDNVGVAGGSVFLTHDGSVRMLRRVRPAIQHFGRIVVGNDTQIGQNCIILPGTRIGSGCIIGAGSTVRGTIPDNSLVVGNPAVVVGRASLFLELLLNSPDSLDSLHQSNREREILLRTHFGVSGSGGPSGKPGVMPK